MKATVNFLVNISEIRLRRAHQKPAIIVASGHTVLLAICEGLDREVERRSFGCALNKAKGNTVEAARIVGMAFQTFIRKLSLPGQPVTHHAE
ncbi:helix-turn-helix domain-containing protein [Pseudophaeobacter leonis]|uniref:helix-turn-helix domain-containing protein n=1 Tax=Pseudophaeobacter leonis TaxID=1144477 RepID=UPI0009F514AC|nr:helix-turn-helix domain-containing protein [Pseudophaeobacter leonis]